MLSCISVTHWRSWRFHISFNHKRAYILKGATIPKWSKTLATHFRTTRWVRHGWGFGFKKRRTLRVSTWILRHMFWYFHPYQSLDLRLRGLSRFCSKTRWTWNLVFLLWRRNPDRRPYKTSCGQLEQKHLVVVGTCTLKRVVCVGRGIFVTKIVPHVLVDYHIWNEILPPQQAKRRLIISQNNHLKEHAFNCRGYSDHVFTEATYWLQQVL